VLASYAATAALGAAGLAMTLLSLRGAISVLGGVGASALVFGVLLKRIDMSL
jgi:hypothetical protein